MGIWAGIKHALNSTLGTADFKPLDELLLEKIAEIVGGKSLAASNTIYKVVSSTAVSLNGGTGDGPEYTKIGNSFTVNCNGSIRVIISVSGGGDLYKNALQYFYITTSVPSGTSPSYVGRITVPYLEDAQTLTLDLNVSAGKKYSFYIGSPTSGKPYYIKCHSAKIGAAVVEGSLIS